MADTTKNASAPSGLIMPSAEELAKARDFANKSKSIGDDDGMKPGRVLDLDYSMYAAAVVDLSEKPDRIEHNRRRHAAKGYVKVGGSPVVMGFPKAEVWVISRADYERNRADRKARIEKAVDDGLMSETALATETVKVNRRKSKG